MRETREIELETVSNGLVIVVRGERVARYETGFSPGFRSLHVAERALTVDDDFGCSGQSLSHGNISGVRFGSIGGAPDHAAAGRNVSGCVDNTENAPVGRIVNDFLTLRRGSQSVGFRHDMDWQDPASNTLLEVGLVVRASATSSCGTALDVSICFSAGEQDEVLLGVTSDSLLHLRLNSKLFPAGGGHIRNGLGDFDEHMINGRRAPWFGCVGVIDAETVGLALIDHPDNPTHPPTWRVYSNGCISVSPFETCSITLMSNESVTLRYRLQTHSGYVDEGWTSARAAEFAREPLRI